MCKSESIKEIATALSKAQGAFDHAKKDVKNEFFKSRYADLASVIDAAKGPLADNGLSVVQVVDMSESGDLYLETILMHVSGEFISGRYPIKPMKADPQATGSAITYARRYAFSAITGIAADDDDGNAASQGAKHPDPVNYKSAIEATKTLDQLTKVWRTIPHVEQEKLTPVATAHKIKLTTQTEQEEAA
jgi:hypothetical protein